MPTLIAFKQGTEFGRIVGDAGRASCSTGSKATEPAVAVEREALNLDPSEEMRTWLAKPRDQQRPQS